MYNIKMLKPTIKRGLMLDFIPDKIVSTLDVNPNRIYQLNNANIGEGNIVYMPTRELRLQDNWAVIFGLDLAKEYNKKFKIVVILSEIKFSKVQEPFLIEGLKIFEKISAQNNIDFEILKELPDNIGALIVDFNPINAPHPQHQPLSNDTQSLLRQSHKGQGKFTPIFEVDSHNIIPARFISQKQEFSAATLRRKIYANITEFLTKYPAILVGGQGYPPYLDDFIENKLNNYAEFKNYPLKDMTSWLSSHLHFGFISSQRVALVVLESSATRENKEAFLEELIVRKELADNFCLYSPSCNTLEGILPWAKATLKEHEHDIRTYVYSLEEFEQAKTHDKLWNKIQDGLIKTGKIHGYLRMYWAKKILEWSKSPQEALKIAIYLNDNYALDGNDPNGYTGILWSIGGLHDRPFTNRFVSGKIRYMNGSKIKF